MICWKCGKEIALSSVQRSDECPFCHVDLHSCRGCDFYSSLSHNDCRESSADMVADKERANFCDYFRVKKALLNESQAEKSSADSSEAARSAAAALFGDASIKKEDSKSAKDAFNALFG